jgi:signal transduction histidine kinase
MRARLQRMLGRLLHRDLSARERALVRLHERERIAGELHDSLMQGMHLLVLQMQALLDQVAHPEARRTLRATTDHLERLLVQGRDRIAGLRAAHHLSASLEKGVRALVDDVSAGLPVAFRVRVRGTEPLVSTDVREEALFIVREALVNALRHADARRIGVLLEFSGEHVRIQVRDDGKGIAPHDVARSCASGHWGLRRMQERASRVQGSVRVRRARGGGTVVVFSAAVHARSTAFDAAGA